MVIAALQEQWCHPEGCTEEDQRTIEAIVKNIKESGKCVFMYSELFSKKQMTYLSWLVLSSYYSQGGRGTA